MQEHSGQAEGWEIFEVRRMVQNNYYVTILSPDISNRRSCKQRNHRVDTAISTAVQPLLVR
jgi:hypothetical protein